MDEVFGVNPKRPDHPDLWRISEVLLHNDGAIEAVPEIDREERTRVFRSIVDPVVDLESATFMAEQRILRTFGADVLTSASLRNNLVGLQLDAFVTGAMYQAAGGHREEGTS